MRAAHVLAFLLASACGGATSGMSGPTLSGRLSDASEEASALQSNDILARDARTKKAVVKHILVSWRDLAGAFDGHQDPRAGARSRAQADELAARLLARVRAGDAMDALMSEFSEDAGSAKLGKPYDVTPDAKLVFEFKRLSMRLDVGEAGLVQTGFGWHIIQRLE